MTNIMTMTIRTGGALVFVALLTLGMAGCDTGGLLEVQDPDLVVPEDATGEKGADLYWAGAVGQFASAYSSGGGGQVVYVGMFTDEFHLSGTFPTRREVDRREITVRNNTTAPQYLALHQARASAEAAAPLLEEHFPGDSRIAEMYNLAGFSYVLFGENYCSGVPYSRAVGNDLEYGEQTTTAQTYEEALARFASALSAAGDDADQEYFARVGQARVLVDQGDYGAAVDAVADVPTDWSYLVRSKAGSDFGQRNAIYEFNHAQRRWSLSDMEGGNGIAWRSESDVRVPWEYNEDVGFDEDTPLYEQLKYPSWEDDTPLASGIEARLIEAEALLADDDVGGFIEKLNELRGTEDELDDVSDPGDPAARVDLLFEERARWLFATAHRLGDLRRMVRQYGRAADDVFPTGEFHKGGSYGSDVNFPIPQAEQENENLTGGEDVPTCLDRSA